MIMSMIFVNLFYTSNAFPDTMEDEINSSGTDDLDINPEEDQFEEPVLGRIIVCSLKSSERLKSPVSHSIQVDQATGSTSMAHKLQIESFYHI